MTNYILFLRAPTLSLIYVLFFYKISFSTKNITYVSNPVPSGSVLSLMDRRDSIIEILDYYDMIKLVSKNQYAIIKSTYVVTKGCEIVSLFKKLT